MGCHPDRKRISRSHQQARGYSSSNSKGKMNNLVSYIAAIFLVPWTHLAAAAQTSSSVAQAAKQYELIKQALGTGPTASPSDIDDQQRPGLRRYLMLPCGSWYKEEYYLANIETDELTSFLVILASDELRWSRNFRYWGFPESIWGPLLRKYEMDNLQDLERTPSAAKFGERGEVLRRSEATLSALAKVLNAHRKKRSSLPMVKVDLDANEYCAAAVKARLEVTVQTDPRGGQIMFIPLFFLQPLQGAGSRS